MTVICPSKAGFSFENWVRLKECINLFLVRDTFLLNPGTQKREKTKKARKSAGLVLSNSEVCNSIRWMSVPLAPPPLPRILYPADHSLPSTAGGHRTASCDQGPRTSSCPCSSGRHHTLLARRLCIFDIGLVSAWLLTLWGRQQLASQVLTVELVS